MGLVNSVAFYWSDGWQTRLVSPQNTQIPSSKQEILVHFEIIFENNAGKSHEESIYVRMPHCAWSLTRLVAINDKSGKPKRLWKLLWECLQPFMNNCVLKCHELMRLTSGLSIQSTGSTNTAKSEWFGSASKVHRRLQNEWHSALSKDQCDGLVTPCFNQLQVMLI